MTVTITQLFPATQLTNAAATIYTAPTTPTTTTVARVRVRFANTDSASHAVTAYAIQTGGTASAANCCCNAETIAANAHLDLDMPQLGPAGFYQAFADVASKVTITCLDGIIFS